MKTERNWAQTGEEPKSRARVTFMLALVTLRFWNSQIRISTCGEKDAKTDSICLGSNILVAACLSAHPGPGP